MAPAAVRVTAGELSGRDEDGLSVFRGVPYAQPPLGELRFAPPQAAEPWSGTRDAFEFGPVSVQALNPHMQQTLAMGPEPVSEDCLTLNVWTPGLDDGRRPVLFFIHGGGFKLEVPPSGGTCPIDPAQPPFHAGTCPRPIRAAPLWGEAAEG